MMEDFPSENFKMVYLIQRPDIVTGPLTRRKSGSSPVILSGVNRCSPLRQSTARGRSSAATSKP